MLQGYSLLISLQTLYTASSSLFSLVRNIFPSTRLDLELLGQGLQHTQLVFGFFQSPLLAQGF